MSDSVDLKGIGLKVTFPRMKILDLFNNSEQRHLSAEDVYRLLLNDGVEMGLATVYRVLTQFEHAGLLKRSQLGGNKAVFELNDGERHHGHLVSTTTGEVEEFYDPQIEKRLQKIADEMGYTLTDHTITLFGTPK
jgi:Fur family transcriptional regulator, ferric uptake regulator